MILFFLPSLAVRYLCGTYCASRPCSLSSETNICRTVVSAKHGFCWDQKLDSVVEKRENASGKQNSRIGVGVREGVASHDPIGDTKMPVGFCIGGGNGWFDRSLRTTDLHSERGKGLKNVKRGEKRRSCRSAP